MNLNWFGTLAGRLALLLALFIIVATAAVVGREYGVGEARQTDDTYRDLNERASVAADRLGQALAERHRLVALWANLETSQDLAVDDLDKRVSLSLRDLASTLDDGTEAVAGRIGGPLLAASDPDRFEQPSLGVFPEFVAEALRPHQAGTTLAMAPTGGVVVASADVVSLVDGTTLGRIVAWTPLRTFLDNALPPELAPSALVDGDGTDLVRSETLSEPDEAYLWGSQSVNTVAGPLEVRVARARSEVVAQIHSSGRKLVSLGVIFLVLALPAMLLVVQSATSGLGGLTRAARELDAVEPQPLPPVSPWAPSEVRVLAEAMGSMIDRLQRARADLARTESLAAVGVLTKSLAHELRTPLAVLKAGTEMLQRTTRSSRDREVIEMLHAEVERLARLVDDLLVFGRPSPPVLTDTDLGEIVTSVVAALEEDAGEHAVSLRVESVPAPLQADPHQVHQVVVNLVTNAVRACEGGGRVIVRACPEPGSVLLTVEDDGKGIPPEHLQTIWEPLFTTHRSGNGLGLPIVRQLVDAHGGSIHVESAPGRGTRVEVVFPTTDRLPTGPARVGATANDGREQ